MERIAGKDTVQEVLAEINSGDRLVFPRLSRGLLAAMGELGT
jgi:hypothetical protein